MDWHDYIEARAGVMCGKPVFKGTRITVEHVMRERAAGTTEAELLLDHPQLTQAHLDAVWSYAAAMISLETLMEA